MKAIIERKLPLTEKYSLIAKKQKLMDGYVESRLHQIIKYTENENITIEQLNQIRKKAKEILNRLLTEVATQ